MKTIRFLTTFAFAFTSLAAAGCSGADPSLDAAGGAGDEHVAQTHEALCSDTTIAPNAVLAVPVAGASVSSTSPSATYGSGPCPSEYVVEFTGSQGKAFNLDASWGPASKLPTTKAACPFALVSATVYGETPAHWVPSPSGWHFVPASWVQLGQPQSAGGHWTDPMPPGVPQLVPVGCSIGLNLDAPNAASYSRIRVAARADGFAIFTTVPEQVTIGAWTPAVIK
jgi:hypothetical protein